MTSNLDNLLNKLGLTEDDFLDIKFILNRKPSLTELAIYSAMWSEHCSYKSSKHWLKKLNTDNKLLIIAPETKKLSIKLHSSIPKAFDVMSSKKTILSV